MELGEIPESFSSFSDDLFSTEIEELFSESANPLQSDEILFLENVKSQLMGSTPQISSSGTLFNAYITKRTEWLNAVKDCTLAFVVDIMLKVGTYEVIGLETEIIEEPLGTCECFISNKRNPINELAFVCFKMKSGDTKRIPVQKTFIPLIYAIFFVYRFPNLIWSLFEDNVEKQKQYVDMLHKCMEYLDYHMQKIE